MTVKAIVGVEAVMRGMALLLLAAATIGFADGASADGKIRLAQSSVTTTCMMTCNSQYANCQSSCLATGTQFTFGSQQQSSPTATSSSANVNNNQTCISSCTNQQLLCQQICARASPSP